MALLGNRLKILHFNPDLEDYMNKNLGDMNYVKSWGKIV